MALRFFSRLPTGSAPHEPPSLDRIARILALASLVIAAGPVLVLFVALSIGLPPLFACVLGAAAFATITGAMSEDAIADAADGLFGGTTVERRLDIMKDSRHGTYGVLAIVFFIALKVSALAAIAEVDALAAPLVWMAATILARSGAMGMALALPPARATGAAATAGRVSRNAFGLGFVFAMITGAVLAIPFTGFSGLALGLVGSAFVVWGWIWVCKKLVGGQTGDLIGASQALVEIVLLGAFVHAIIA